MAEPSWFHPLPAKQAARTVKAVTAAGIRKNRVKTDKVVRPGSAVMSGSIQVGTTGSTTRWSATAQSKTQGAMTAKGHTRTSALEMLGSDRRLTAQRLRAARAARHRPAGSPAGGQFY